MNIKKLKILIAAILMYSSLLPAGAAEPGISTRQPDAVHVSTDHDLAALSTADKVGPPCPGASNRRARAGRRMSRRSPNCQGANPARSEDTRQRRGDRSQARDVGLPAAWRTAKAFGSIDPYHSLGNQVLDVQSSGPHRVPRFAQSISMIADGSTGAGPLSADYGQSVFVSKAGGATSTIEGEIGGGTVNVRQGLRGDASGVLYDVRAAHGSGTGFLTAIEAVATQTDTAGSGKRAIRAFLAINSGSGVTDAMPSKGLAVLADYGANHVGAYFAGNGGSFQSVIRYDDFGGHPLWRVQPDGGMLMGNPRTAGTPYIHFQSSGHGSQYDASIYARGGTAATGGGAVVVQAQTLELARPALGITLPLVSECAVPTPAVGSETFFANAADGKLWRKDSSGKAFVASN